MKYKISDISKISRISTSGLRFYEDLGIISPSRGKNQKYRDYDQRELDIIFGYKAYRVLGFSQKESVSMLIDDNPEEIYKKYELCQERILREIEEKQILAEFVEEQAEQIKRSMNEKHTCRIEINPTFLRIEIWQPGKQEGNYVPFGLLQEWYDRVPFVDACFMFNPADIENKSKTLRPNLGVGIEEKYATALRFQPASGVEVIPSRQCVHTFVEITEELTIKGADLEHVRQFIGENHLSISGQVLSRHLYNVYYKAANIRLDHLWIPVQQEN